MENQYYPSYAEETNVSESVGHIQPLVYAEQIPQDSHGTLAGSPYEDPTLHLTHITYPEQNYLTHPMQQSLSASAESHYDYSQGFGLEEGLHMPESQREIARERRKAQNRAAQKAFRSRKENRIKELEQRLAVVENNYKALEKAFEEVKSEKEQLRAELADISTEHSSLKGSRISSPASPSDVSRLPSLSRESTDLQYFSGYEEPLPFLETNPST